MKRRAMGSTNKVALFSFLFFYVQVNGTQLAAVWFDGTVIAWSYPKGEILFQIKGNSRDEIKWNPFRQDVFAASHRVRNAVNYLFHSPLQYLFIWRRKESCK